MAQRVVSLSTWRCRIRIMYRLMDSLGCKGGRNPRFIDYFGSACGVTEGLHKGKDASNIYECKSTVELYNSIDDKHSGLSQLQ